MHKQLEWEEERRRRRWIDIVDGYKFLAYQAGIYVGIIIIIISNQNNNNNNKKDDDDE